MSVSDTHSMISQNRRHWTIRKIVLVVNVLLVIKTFWQTSLAHQNGHRQLYREKSSCGVIISPGKDPETFLFHGTRRRYIPCYILHAICQSVIIQYMKKSYTFSKKMTLKYHMHVYTRHCTVFRDIWQMIMTLIEWISECTTHLLCD